MRKPLLLFGGTFDPVHFGHLIVARAAAEELGAERVLLLPTACPPHKNTPITPAEHRLAMLKLAVAGDPLFEVSTLELDRSGPSYTYDTLLALRRQQGAKTPLIWLVGLDMLLELASWYRATDVVALARIVTAVRPPVPPDLADRLAALRETFPDEQVDRLTRDMLQTPLLDISATDLRRRAQAGEPIRYLTPNSVCEYILKNNLYEISVFPGKESGRNP